MEPHRLRELLEATRATELDSGLSEVEALELRELLDNDPALQAELARIGEWDGAIGSTVDDVPVPVGLADRLRSRVAEEFATFDSQAPVAPASQPKPVAVRPSRRGWLLGIVATAAALLLAIGAGTYLSQPATIDVAQLEQEVGALASDLDTVAWQPAGSAYPAEAFPGDVRFPAKRWGQVSTSLDRQAYIFDLGAPGATLIAMRTRAASVDIPSRPSLAPTSTTGNVCMGHWQKDGYVFSLVVRGSKARYQMFLRDAGSLTANW